MSGTPTRRRNARADAQETRQQGGEAGRRACAQDQGACMAARGVSASERERRVSAAMLPHRHCVRRGARIYDREVSNTRAAAVRIARPSRESAGVGDARLRVLAVSRRGRAEKTRMVSVDDGQRARAPPLRRRAARTHIPAEEGCHVLLQRRRHDESFFYFSTSLWNAGRVEAG